MENSQIHISWHQKWSASNGGLALYRGLSVGEEDSVISLIEYGLCLHVCSMEIMGELTIGSSCWIGAGGTIPYGVAIGDNAIVGAHFLVREAVPGGVCCGNACLFDSGG